MLSRILQSRFSTSPYNILKQHNQVYQYTSPQLKSQDFVKNQTAKHQSPSVYCGYDPTANSLHLGNLLSIIALGRLSTIGLRPVFLIGGATAQIGDPSGKVKQRAIMPKQLLHQNIKGIHSDLQRVYTNILKKLQKANQQGLPTEFVSEYKIINNIDFYQNFNVLDFMSEVGRHFRLGVLLAKENISSRMESEEGMAYSEFSYSLLQAHDFYKLYTTEGCILQIGGSDQWGNITNGCDYIKKKTKTEAFGLTLPLLTSSNGLKFGKTEDNALFLNPQKTSTTDVYNYFYNTSDDKIEDYLRLFTFLSSEQIDEVMVRQKQQPERRPGQKKLCEQVFSILYSDKDNIHSLEQILRIPKSKLRQTRLSELSQMIKHVKTFEVKRSQLRVIRDFAQLMTYLNLKSSRAQVRRQIDNGGVYLNNQKVTPELNKQAILGVMESELLHNSFVLVRFGKKNMYVVKVIMDE